MEEHLADRLLKAANVMHWLGKYTESNALVMTSRLARVLGLDDEAKFAAYVETIEERTPLSESVDP